MYVNAIMIPVETVPGIRGVGMKESNGGSDFKYDIFEYIVRTFVNATMYPCPTQQ
jgi:hypothetical protein